MAQRPASLVMRHLIVAGLCEADRRVASTRVVYESDLISSVGVL